MDFNISSPGGAVDPGMSAVTSALNSPAPTSDQSNIVDQILTNHVVSQGIAEDDAKSGEGSAKRQVMSSVRGSIASGARAIDTLTGSKKLDDFAAQEEAKSQAEDVNDTGTFSTRNLSDVHGVGDLLSYTGRQALRLAPQVAAMYAGGAVGGIFGGAAGLGEEGVAAAQAAGTLAPTELPSIGDSGTQDPAAAAVLGTASNALNILGVGGKVVRGLPISQAASRLGRVAEGAASDSITQGLVAGGQQAIEEVGKATDDQNYDPTGPQARGEILSAAAQGAAAGGLIGAVHGAVSGAPKVKAADVAPVENTPAADEASGTPTQLLLTGRVPGTVARNETSPEGASLTGNTDKTVGPTSSVPTDLFTGSTPETLRPTEGVGAMARAIAPDQTERTKQYAVDLASTLHTELSRQNPDQAEYTIAQLEDQFQQKQIPVTPAVSQVIQNARDVVQQYRDQHEQIAPGVLQAKTPVPETVPSNYDPLATLWDMIPQVKLSDVRAASKGLSDTKIAPLLHGALKAGDAPTVARMLQNAYEVASRQRVNKDAAIAAVNKLSDLSERHLNDLKAHDQLTDEMTAPAPEKPQGATTGSAEAATPGTQGAKPGEPTPVDTAVSLQLQNEIKKQQQEAAAKQNQIDYESKRITRFQDLLADPSETANFTADMKILGTAHGMTDPKQHELTPQEASQLYDARQKAAAQKKAGDQAAAQAAADKVINKSTDESIAAAKARKEEQQDTLDEHVKEQEETQRDAEKAARENRRASESAKENAKNNTPQNKAPKPTHAMRQTEMFNDRETGPVGTTRVERHEKAQTVQKETLNRRREDAQPNEDQPTLFQKPEEKDAMNTAKGIIRENYKDIHPSLKTDANKSKLDSLLKSNKFGEARDHVAKLKTRTDQIEARENAKAEAKTQNEDLKANTPKSEPVAPPKSAAKKEVARDPLQDAVHERIDAKEASGEFTEQRANKLRDRVSKEPEAVARAVGMKTEEIKKAGEAQLPLFGANKKPSVYARGESQITQDHYTEQARSQKIGVAKSLMDDLEKLAKDNPDIPRSKVAEITKLTAQRKFGEAGKALDAEKQRIFKSEKPETVKPEEAKARGNLQDLMSKYQNDVSERVPDKVMGHIEKGDFDKANAVIDKERTRIEDKIRASGTTPEAAKDQNAKSKTRGPAATKDALMNEGVGPRNQAFAKYTLAQLKEMQRQLKESGYDRSMLPRGTKPMDLHEEIATRQANGEGKLPKGPLQERVRLYDSTRETVPGSVEAQAHIAKVQADVNEITRDWKNKPEIQVFDSRDPKTDEQDAFIDFEHQMGVEGGAAGQLGENESTNRSVIMIPADRVISKTDLMATLYHEGLGHYGLRGAFRQHTMKLLYDLYTSNKDIHDDVNRRMEEIPYEDPDIPHANIIYHTEENLVTRLERNPNPTQSWFAKLKTAVQLFARRMGMRSGEFTPDEIQAILRRSAEFTRNGKAPNEPVGSMDQTIDRNLPVVAGTSAPRMTDDPRELPRLEPGLLPRVPRGSELLPRKNGPFRVRNTEEDPTPVHRATEITRATERVLGTDTSRSATGKLIVKGIVNADAMMRQVKMGFNTGRTLVEKATSLGVKDYKDYYDLATRQQAESNKYTKRLDTILTRAAALGPETKAVNSFLKSATLSQKWGFVPDHDKTIVPDSETAARFNALSPSAQSAVRDIFKFNRDSRDDLQRIVHDYINKDADESLKGSLSAEEKARVQEMRGRQLRMFDKAVPKLDGPYAPLSRFGDYITTAKSKEFADLEANEQRTPAENSRFQDLHGDADHYAVFFRDSLGDAEAKAEEMRKSGKFDQAYASTRTEAYNQLGESPLLQMQKLQDMVKNQLGEAGFDRDNQNKIQNMLKDLYITTIAENSARRHDTRRLNVDGADDNMLKSMQYKGRADAHFIAQMIHRPEINSKLQTIMDQINGDKKHPQYQERKDLLKEITTRHTGSLVRDQSKVGDKILSLSAAYHLTFSPRYYLQNATQPAMVTIPWLAGKHGYGRSWAALNGAYGDIWPSMKTPGFWTGKMNISDLGIKDANERSMLEDANNHGLLDIGMQQEFQNYDITSKTGSTMARLQQWHNNLKSAGQAVEVMNRTTTALAAYRLGIKDGMSHDEASAWAKQTIGKTQFDYSSLNAPRYYNQASQSLVGKLALQFRKYTINQIGLFAGMAKNIINNSAPGDRAVATKQMTYMLGHLLAVSGAVGLPGAQLVGYLGAEIFGGDQPADSDHATQEALESFLGKDLGDIVTRGPVGAMFGVELSGVGLGNLLNPVPFGSTTSDNPNDQFNSKVVGALGPTVGIAQNAYRSISQLSDGDYTRAAISGLPSGPSYILRSLQQSVQGQQNARGDLLMKPDEINYWNELTSILGFPSTTQLSQQRQANFVYEARAYFKDRASDVIKDYTTAARDGDSATMGQLRQQWQDLNVARQRVGEPVAPLSELLRAPAAQATRERLTKNGVQLRKGEVLAP